MFKPKSNVKHNNNRRKTFCHRGRGVPRAIMAISKTSAVPDRFKTKLRYSSLHGISTAGIGVPTVYSYRVNSIYDPDLTGTGHQPLGFDQMAALYNKYTVQGVAWTVTFTNQSTTNYADICVVFRPNTNTVSLMSTALECPYAYRGVLGPETGARNIQVMKGYVSIAKLRGVPESKVINENEYSALVSTNPNVVPTMQIYIEDQNVAASINVNFRVELTYYVTFYDIQALSQS